ncbi:MAG: histidinol-phosphatase HisJ family protein [Defluviitaleaceae bacterium]|nr:histidinol-phosphatase HisJ family protein [Defluviitaleaceae bacterium]
MNDMHVHTFCSSDSEETFANYVDRAREIGVNVICFTDHVDYNPNDFGTGYYNSTNFFTEFNKTKMKVCDIELLAGIEFDCPHRYQDELKALASLPYDCIIGGVHYCNLSPDLFFSELVKNGVSVEECFSAYWHEVQKCVEHGGFDVLAHIDIPKRYLKSLIYDDFHLLKIFNKMISANIILEINTSSLRKGLSDTMPSKALLELYRSAGGKYITIGSDAHYKSELASDYEIARKLCADVGLQEVIFRERKMIIA